MSNRRVAGQLMSRIPADSHEKRGRANAVKVAQNAIARTRAYPEFVRSQLGSVPPISSFEDFARLPLTDKTNYINYNLFDIEQLCLDGDPSRAYTIEKSSGHSGNCYYWLRTPAEDAMFPKYLEFAFAQFYGIESKRTLILITLALGTWTSGEKMAQALRQVAATGRYPITVMAPGMHAEEVLEIVRDLSAMYDQTVIVGYPPFLRAVVDDGVREGIDWPSLHVRLGLGGEGYSEQWRDQMGALLGVDPSRELLAISGGYGAADVGMTVGREYPLTVLLRRLCREDEALAARLFFGGKAPDGTLPSLLQYNPATVFAEEVEGELVFTALSGIPIVRYNIHDRGGVLSFESVLNAVTEAGYDPYAMLSERGYTRQDVWNLPFLYCFGRSDGTIHFNGLNVHPDHIEAALGTLEDVGVVGFRVGVETDPESEHQRLVVLLEHRDPPLSATDWESEYGQALHAGLRAVNREFRHLHEIAADRTALRVEVHPRNGGPFASEKESIKRHYVARAGSS